MIVGLGTGRCGTVSLAKWLGTFHEASPRFTEHTTVQEIEDHANTWTKRAKNYKFTPGDVSLTQIYALDYWVKTDATIILLMRDREETASSIYYYQRGQHIWQKHFPQFDFSTIKGCLDYWDWYYEKALKHEDRLIVISPHQIPITHNKGDYKKRTTEDTTKYAEKLPKFGEVVRRKRGVIKDFNGDRVAINWDWNEWSHKHQMFRLEVEGKCSKGDHTCTKDVIVSKQALEHFTRAV